MALENIGSSNRNDAFYRYKMPRMRTRIESRGNGVGTRIENMADIAKALTRPARDVTNYFKHELGAQSEFDAATGTALVKGAHDAAKLASHLDNFIRKYVQCYGCRNPETEVVVSRAGAVSLKCAACGFISEVGVRDKVFKHRPAKEAVVAAGNGNKQRKLKKKAEAKKKKAGTSSCKGSTTDQGCRRSVSPTTHDHHATAAEVNDDDVQWQTDTSLEAAKQRVQEQLSAATAGMVMLSTEDGSDEKTKKKQAAYLQAEQSRGDAAASATSDHLIRAVLSSSSTQPSSKQDAMNSMFEALFGGARNAGLKDEVKKNVERLAVAVRGEVSSQVLLLRAMEEFGAGCGVEALKDVPFVLEALYNEDVLEEEAIVQWYNEAVSSGGRRNSRVVRMAKPFVEWLQSVDCGSSSEDQE